VHETQPLEEAYILVDPILGVERCTQRQKSLLKYSYSG